jgi:hypothetical protein
MFISKTHLNRRTFLRGMGATIALPLFDAMLPARTALAATAARAAPRMMFVYFPHGAIMSEWTPPAAGNLVHLGRILQSLTPFRNRLTIVSGIENRHAHGPVHAITPGTWLSGISPRARATPQHGATADQIAARHIYGDTLLQSIEVATEAPPRIGAGAWEGEYNDGLGTTISLRGHAAPQPMECAPRRVFDKLFAPGTTPEERARLAQTSASVLDVVSADRTHLQARLGPTDRAVLGDYLDTVRDVECRVAKAEASTQSCAGTACDEAAAFAERLQLMFDMMTLAFHADITRVASFMMAAETSRMTYDHVGVPNPFHQLSHHQNDPEKIEKLVQIQSYHTCVFAAFVQRLADLRDGDGSVLDRSLILYGSNMSDSHAHDHFPLPLAIVGGGCGTLRGGRHLRYPDRTPQSNVLLTMLHRAGVPMESFGDSTGECSEI